MYFFFYYEHTASIFPPNSYLQLYNDTQLIWFWSLSSGFIGIIKNSSQLYILQHIVITDDNLIQKLFYVIIIGTKYIRKIMVEI